MSTIDLGGTNVYKNPGVLMGNWVEDRFIMEANKRKKSGAAQIKMAYTSEQRLAYEWPDPSKSRDADTRGGVPTFAVPPVPRYETRIELDKSQPAGLRMQNDNQQLNLYQWNGSAKSPLPVSTTHMPSPPMQRRSMRQ